MEDKQPLLSICIPTYNRADKLNRCLQAIFDASDDKTKEKCEIIISDNASEDNTRRVVNLFQEKGLEINYNRNIENLGFNKNIMLLWTKYANGKFIWLIGDDDYIDKDCLKFIIETIEADEDIDLILLKLRRFSKMDDYTLYRNDQYNSTNRKLTFTNTNISQALESTSDFNNILCTFMTSMIYKKSKLRFELLDKINDNTWEVFIDVFPHTYLVLTSFINQAKIVYIDDAVISNIDCKLDWNDNIAIVGYKFLPDLYTYLIGLGIEKRVLKRTRGYIFLANIQLVKRNILNRYMILNAFRFLSLTSLRLFFDKLIGLIKRKIVLLK